MTSLPPCRRKFLLSEVEYWHLEQEGAVMFSRRRRMEPGCRFLYGRVWSCCRCPRTGNSGSILCPRAAAWYKLWSTFFYEPNSCFGMENGWNFAIFPIIMRYFLEKVKMENLLYTISRNIKIPWYGIDKANGVCYTMVNRSKKAKKSCSTAEKPMNK